MLFPGRMPRSSKTQYSSVVLKLSGETLGEDGEHISTRVIARRELSDGVANPTRVIARREGAQRCVPTPVIARRELSAAVRPTKQSAQNAGQDDHRTGGRCWT